MTNPTNNGLNQFSMQFQRLQNQFRQNQSDVVRKDFEELQAQEQENTTPELETQNPNGNRPRLELPTPIQIRLIPQNTEHEQDQNKENENTFKINDVLIQMSKNSNTNNNVFGPVLPDNVFVNIRNIEFDRGKMFIDFEQKIEPQLPTNDSPSSDLPPEYNLDQVETKEESQKNLNTGTNVEPEKKTGQEVKDQNKQKE